MQELTQAFNVLPDKSARKKTITAVTTGPSGVKTDANV